jgi:hypothetical protein
LVRVRKLRLKRLESNMDTLVMWGMLAVTIQLSNQQNIGFYRILSGKS